MPAKPRRRSSRSGSKVHFVCRSTSRRSIGDPTPLLNGPAGTPASLTYPSAPFPSPVSPAGVSRVLNQVQHVISQVPQADASVQNTIVAQLAKITEVLDKLSTRVTDNDLGAKLEKCHQDHISDLRNAIGRSGSSVIASPIDPAIAERYSRLRNLDAPPASPSPLSPLSPDSLSYIVQTAQDTTLPQETRDLAERLNKLMNRSSDSVKLMDLLSIMDDESVSDFTRDFARRLYSLHADVPKQDPLDRSGYNQSCPGKLATSYDVIDKLRQTLGTYIPVFKQHKDDISAKIDDIDTRLDETLNKKNDMNKTSYDILTEIQDIALELRKLSNECAKRGT